jgi:hypothetical protein
MRTSKGPLFFMLMLWAISIRAELTLKPVHPDETVAQTLGQRFSLPNALSGLDAIGSYLESFRRLTAAARGVIPAKKMNEIGNTGWEIQELAFRNLPRTIEGALRYREWLLKKTLYQLVVVEGKAGKASAAKIEQARQELEQAEKEFQKFWDTLAVAD